VRAPLGIVEGFFGRSYSWAERALMADALGPRGFSHWTYAPKADRFLRRDWRLPHPAPEAEALAAFGVYARSRGLAFSLGLSPLGLNEGYDATARAALRVRIDQLIDLGIDALSLLFDDMKGDFPDLAATQVHIAHDVSDWLGGRPLTLCPSYYSDDPVLDRVFGARPEGYLEALGQGLDPAVGLYWTGEKVCSPGYPAKHLMQVAETLRRLPTLWDNYPVNDGPRMYRHLHLRPFAGRDSCDGAAVARHEINPMTQAHLGLIPLLTLLDEGGSDAARVEAAASSLFGEDLGRIIAEDLPLLHDLGLDMADDEEARLRLRYGVLDHPAAREIIDWLDGKTAISLHEVQTQ
jgi:hypothetical protein